MPSSKSKTANQPPEQIENRKTMNLSPVQNKDKNTSKRKYLSQTDVPRVSLNEALRIPFAIYENYGGNPTSPLKVAQALELTPNSGHFRIIAGAAVAYGLTDGGPNAPQIGITPLGSRVVKPLVEEDDFHAKRDSFLKPQIISAFLTKYDNSPFPREDIAKNVLVELGVPKDRADEVLGFITEEADRLGLLTDIKGKKYVSLSNDSVPNTTTQDFVPPILLQKNKEMPKTDEALKNVEVLKEIIPIAADNRAERLKRVFITHGKNREFIEPIKKLLAFGEFQPVVETEKETVAKPVPDKVLDSMRSCGAAIIHVDAEQILKDDNGQPCDIINSNVLIEIGASMALYGRRFILIVRQGINLPSNLQGLFEVRYQGDSLDGNATVRLLEAIMDIKNNPLP
jgi:predicted nucleotide-binding protein